MKIERELVRLRRILRTLRETQAKERVVCAIVFGEKPKGTSYRRGREDGWVMARVVQINKDNSLSPGPVYKTTLGIWGLLPLSALPHQPLNQDG